MFSITSKCTTRQLGPYKERIQALLDQNATLPRKQRWTSPSIYREICRDGYQGRYTGIDGAPLYRPGPQTAPPAAG
ncbi:MAG: hypothetical protein R6X18_19270, partial [Chloroflexota bacterium]